MPAECGVPRGFCITVNAWKRQINDNKDLLLPLKALRDVGKGIIDGGLEEYCREASILIASAPVDHHVQDCIREALQVNIPIFFFSLAVLEKLQLIFDR